MKSKTKIIMIVAVVVGIVLGVGGVQVFHTRTQASRPCESTNANAETHNVMIMDGKSEPAKVTGKLCDSLIITNMDSVAREIAFGAHANHVPYDGVAEQVLNAGQSFTITLNQLGSFEFHDHLHPLVAGYFTVTK